MIVPENHLLRDASGRFGCPNCWQANMATVQPADLTCPFCGVTLDWTPETRRLSNLFKGRSQRSDE